MDAIEILVSLLGSKSRGAGSGSKGRSLDDIFGGSKPPAQPPQPTGSRGSQTGAPTSSNRSDMDVDRHARELEDLLNVAKKHDRTTRQESPFSPSPSQPPFSTRASDTPFSNVPAEPPRSTVSNTSSPPLATPRSGPLDSFRPKPAETINDKATILVRAMLGAAKCDGNISQSEQDRILQNFDRTTPGVIRYLQDELARPHDLREFIWSVPIGMEQQVYMISAATIDIDHPSEVEYLRNLAHGFRFSPEFVNQMHQRLGIRLLY